MKSHIEKKIIEFCSAYGELLIQLSNNRNIELSDDASKEIDSIEKYLVEFFFNNPGSLIEFENKSDMEYAKIVLNIMWDSLINPEEAFENLSNDFLVYNLSDLIVRLKLLKPTMLLRVKATYSEKFKIFYEEAMKSWLFGLNNASIILCTSILENALKEILTRFSLDYQNENLGILIKDAYKFNAINYDTKEKLFQIKNIRNYSVHELENFSSETTLDLIVTTKDIIEKLYLL